MDGSDGQTCRTNMMDGRDGQTRQADMTDVTGERRHGTVRNHCSRAGHRTAGAAMNLNRPD